MVTAIIGAIVGTVSATVSIVKAKRMKDAGLRAVQGAKIQAQEQEALARRTGAYTRLAQSRISIIQAQAEQAKLLGESKKTANRLVLIGVCSSLVLLTIVGMKRQ